MDYVQGYDVNLTEVSQGKQVDRARAPSEPVVGSNELYAIQMPP